MTFHADVLEEALAVRGDAIGSRTRNASSADSGARRSVRRKTGESASQPPTRGDGHCGKTHYEALQLWEDEQKRAIA